MRDFTSAARHCLGVLALVASFAAVAQAPVTRHGAVPFNDDHAFTKALVKFEELVKQYYGKPIVWPEIPLLLPRWLRPDFLK